MRRKTLKTWLAVLAATALVLTVSLPNAFAGPIILSGMDPEDHGTGGRTMISDILAFVVDNSSNNGAVGNGSNVLVLGPSGGIGFSGTSVSTIATGLGFTTTFATGSAAISGVSFSGFDAIYMPTASRDISGGLTSSEIVAINGRSSDIVGFVNSGGGLASFAQNVAGGYGWFPLGGLNTSDLGGGGLSGISLTAIGSTILAPSATAVQPFHTTFNGPTGFFGLDVLATERGGQQRALIIGGGANTVIAPPPSVPEPVTGLILGIGVMGLAVLRRKA